MNTYIPEIQFGEGGAKLPSGNLDVNEEKKILDAELLNFTPQVVKPLSGSQIRLEQKSSELVSTCQSPNMVEDVHFNHAIVYEIR
ncbi:hypothetical protein NPIL_581851 [Nephila pilipes]|uniref:Uncharacterized protein n=1 Tax=Nephila pilipes TaxID=299642 RepID=A0A8X6U416_NEPPI|nr:hypothetical protein NPIL_581851 [Nephila pilipes]